MLQIYPRMCMTAELLLLMSFWVPAYSNTVVSGDVGEDVILPCTVEYKEEFSYNTLNILWKTEHIHVYSFFYGNFQEEHQDEIFKGRAQLFHAEFPKGNVSLLLRNIQTSDAGIYTCSVFISKYTHKRITELVVRDRSHAYTSESSEVKVSVVVIMVCLIIGFIAFLRRRKRSRGTPCKEDSKVD
ncbi:hypothetical protein GDO81_010275 [Engystomops pustulosus]|uniref:Ig-like domain-containing protein n=1 Tax=Engystomops pustulosus TaxID=76066 RepID=A0AAV7BZA5_ENGPU|nr:hypothetical protein GDO81_010275 [Engystomops pustulosus]